MPATKETSAQGRVFAPPGWEAGFRQVDRRDMEALASRELRGVVETPKLLSDAGLWVTLLAREPCCGARVLLSIRPRESLDEDCYAELVEAAVANRGVREPVVLPVRRFGRTDRLVWVTTRAYRGRLLGHALAADSTRPMAGVVGFLRQVAGPLEAVHRTGLVHGALDSGSFHRDTEGRIRVRNLGVDLPVLRASLRAGVGAEAVVCASPEVADGAPPTAESDQYALAALSLRALTGRTPDRGGRWSDSGVPEEARAALRRALHRDPRERFDSVLDLWGALDAERFRATTPSNGGGTRSAPTSSAEEGYVTSAFRRRARRRDFEAGSGAPETRDRDAGWDPDMADPYPDAPWRHEESSRGPTIWGRAAAAAVVLLLFSGTVELLTRDPVTPKGARPRAVAEDPRGSVEVSSGSSPQAPLASAMGAEAQAAGGERTGPDLRPSDVTNSAPSPGQAEMANPPAASVEDSPAVPAADSPSSDRTSVGSGRVPDRSVAPSSAPVRTPTGVAAREPYPTAPPSPPGRLFLQSYPWGEVYVDGDYLGNSPIVDVRISSGPHTIRVVRSGYRPYLAEVTVEPGRSLRLTGIVLTEGGAS